MSLESISTSSSNESENETDELTFHNACVVGNLDVVKVYLAQPEFDMNIGDNDGRTGRSMHSRSSLRSLRSRTT